MHRFGTIEYNDLYGTSCDGGDGDRQRQLLSDDEDDDAAPLVAIVCLWVIQ